MKKISLLLMSLSLSVCSMAQNIQVNRTIDNTLAFNSDYITVKFTGKPALTKSAAAELSNVQTGNNQQYGNYISYTITPNDECFKVGVLVQEAGIVSGAIAQGMTPAAVFELAEQQFQAQGQSLYIDVTPGEAVTRATIHLDANKNYEISLLAIGTEGDSVYSSQPVSFNGQADDKQGLAELTIIVKEIESSSAKLVFTVNDQTSYFYYLAGYTDNMQSQGLTDLTTFTQAVPQLLQQDYLQKLTSSAEGTIPNLQANTSYTIIALPYNGKDEAGKGDVKEFTTKSVGINDIDFTEISVYPNPASEKIIINSFSQIQRVDLFNAMGQRVYFSDIKANGVIVPTNDLANGCYVLKVSTVDNTFVRNIIIK